MDVTKGRILGPKKNRGNNIPQELKDELRKTIQEYKAPKLIEEEFKVKYTFPDEKTFDRLLANMERKGFSLLSRTESEAVFTKKITNELGV